MIQKFVIYRKIAKNWKNNPFFNFCDKLCSVKLEFEFRKGVRTHVFGLVHWGLDRKWCICATCGLTWKNSATYIILASKWCPADNFFDHITPTDTANHSNSSQFQILQFYMEVERLWVNIRFFFCILSSSFILKIPLWKPT